MSGYLYSFIFNSHCIRYGVFSSTLEYRNFDGRLIVLNFNTSKLNNWNRVLYLENKDGRFSRYDNGIIKEGELRQSTV
jgi:hypothetical protein